MTARLFSVAAAFALAACAMPWASEAPAGAPLAGTKWVGVPEGSMDPKNVPRLEFTTTGRVAGYSGCNNFSTSFTESRGVAAFGQVSATKRFCAGIEGEVEERVLPALSLGGVAERRNGKLVVTGPGGTRYDFVPATSN